MNPSSHFPSAIARRDWLKTAAFGGATAFLTGAGTTEEPENKPSGNVRGVIFMVADGMSPGVLTMAEHYSQITRKTGTAWWKLINDKSSARGLMDTASASSIVTDSAAASSAWGGGQRVNNGAINVDVSGRTITPIAAILKKTRKARVGLVTTATVTHATPAGFASSVPSRGNEHQIAPQYLDRVDVILGGGAGFFDPKQRPDKRDLGGDFISAGYQMVADRDALLASRSERLLGAFTAGHLPYSIDRDHAPELLKRIPSLKEMAMAALSRFLADDRPFLLQIEGARVDHAAHLNDIAGMLGEQLAFDDTLAAVIAAVSGRSDILVVVTSDHGNSNPGINGTGAAYGESTRRFSRISGMKASHERIFSEWMKLKNAGAGQLSDLVQTHLDFKLKPDEADALLDVFRKRPVVEWNHQHGNPEGLLGQFAGNHTAVGWTGTSHTSDPTIVTATGPQSGRFGGMVTNTDVFAHLNAILC